jgi:3-phytase|tara:strand:- start:2980 stop:4077 length:1098 start_codon:yes stop_codon:yes gene_type:complete
MKYNSIRFAILITIFSTSIYAEVKSKVIYKIQAMSETPQIITKGDAADDPAIWLNTINPLNTLIFGTDKKSGIYTYDLKSNEIDYSKIGLINNIDVRSMDVTNDDNEDIGSYSFLFASNRTSNTLDVWFFSDKETNDKIDKGVFKLPLTPSVSARTNMIVYGVCGGLDPYHGLIAFITEDEGSQVQMWRYTALGLSLVATFDNGNAVQSEGCVYDDQNRTLLISEEQDRGILRAYKIDNNLDFLNPTVIDTRDGYIVGDPEGISIYKTSDIEGYIVLSSQGDNTINIYNRQLPYDYLGSFEIEKTDLIDGVSDTDGVDSINFNFNANLPNGLLVVQDGWNDLTGTPERQNFKYISFKQIIDKLNP